MFEDKYGSDLLEDIIGQMVTSKDSIKFDTEYGELIASCYHSYEGGLEGYYLNHICGSVELGDNLELWEFDIRDEFCSATEVEITLVRDYEIKNDKGENNMAKLSERVNDLSYNKAGSKFSGYLPKCNPTNDKTTINTKGDSNMNNTLRTLNLTLVDNNPNLKAAEKIVFQSLNYVTEHSDDRTIQQILMSGKVAAALVEHNEKRIKVIDKQIQRNTGRDVMLEEVEIFELNWQVVQIA